jgi:hypothetical protein
LTVIAQWPRCPLEVSRGILLRSFTLGMVISS